VRGSERILWSFSSARRKRFPISRYEPCCLELKYAGIKNAAILNGGQDKWVKEKRALSQDMVKAKAKPYKPNGIRTSLWINPLCCQAWPGHHCRYACTQLLRGKEKLPFVAKLGRIKGATNLPVGPTVYKEGLYKDKAELASLATKAVGNDMSKEFILYVTPKDLHLLGLCDDGNTGIQGCEDL